MTNSPRVLSDGGGHRKNACDGGLLAPIFNGIDSGLRWSADSVTKTNMGGGPRRRPRQCRVGAGMPTTVQQW
jgi:hypothetical protein